MCIRNRGSRCIKDGKQCLELYLSYVIQNQLLCQRYRTLTRWAGYCHSYLCIKDCRKMLLYGLINQSK